jgi:microcompartment protein CcmL/EutN
VRRYPSIAVIEFASMADGIFCTDALLKKAPIGMIKAGTVSGGRYLIIIGGSTGSVDESLQEAIGVSEGGVLDHVFLPDIHDSVHDLVLGKRGKVTDDPIAILETDTVSANIRAAELALKGTDVRLVEIRIADYEMSGKAISIYNGNLYEIEAAMDLAHAFLHDRKEYVKHRIIPNPHEMLAAQIGKGTRFATGTPLELEGEEVS